MDSEHFALLPRNTNLVEGAHAKRNAETGTGLSILEGILLCVA
jgi:hypothetical protein